MKVLFLYNRPRKTLHEAKLKGESPDELLYCYESVKQYGIEPHYTDRGFAKDFWTFSLQFIERYISKKGERVGFNLNQALNLRKEFSKYDLIFATADSSALPLLFLKSIGLVDVPVVYATIGLAEAFRRDMSSPVFKFYKRLLTFAERIIHYGYGEGEILRQDYGVLLEKLRFVPLGTDSEIFQKYRDIKTDDYILTLGVDRQRDWLTFLRSVKGLEASFKLVTDPLLLRGLTWPPNVEVLPLRSMSEISEMIARAKFVVLPVKQNCYTAATFTLLQSMAMGKAVIVSKTEAIESGYTFEFGKELLTVEPKDMLYLRLTIKALLADPARVKEMGMLAAGRIKQSYTIDRYAKDISDIFREALR